MIRSDPKVPSAQSKPGPTSSASSTSSSRRGGGEVRETKEASVSSTKDKHPSSSRASAKGMEGVESDDEGRKVAGGSRREEQHQGKMKVDQHQAVAKSSSDFGIDPSVKVVPSEKLSRCRQIILPPSTPITPTRSPQPSTPAASSHPSPLSSGRKLLDVFQTVVERRPLDQQAKTADELFVYLKTILEAPLMGYKFIVLGFAHIEIRYAVQAAISKLGGRYLLEKELETTTSEEGESVDVDFVLVSNSLSLPLPNNTSPLARAINTRSLPILRPGDDIKLPSSFPSSTSRRSEVLVSSAFFEEVVGICLRENASYSND